MSSNKISLLEHQTIPIEYLIARCKNQKGLLVNHYMGTGKTIIALTFLKNFKSNKKVIVSPRSIKNHWITETKKLNITNVSFITFDELENFENFQETIKDSICVVDEAHGLYPLFDKFEFEKAIDEKKYRLIKFIDFFYSTKKILLMTGTLVTKMGAEGLADIRWLINLSAGKSVVPYNINLFINKYYNFSKFDKLYYRIFSPLIKKNPLEIFPKNITERLNIKSDNFVDFMFKLSTNFVLVDVLFKNFKNQKIGKLTFKLLINLIEELLKKSNYKDLLLSLLITFILKGVPLIFNHINTVYKEQYGFYKFNTKKLMENNVGSYISYFNYKFNKTEDYPIVNEYIKRVPYTKEQLKLVIKMLAIPENLTDDEYVDLAIHKDIKEAELYKDYTKVLKYYTNNGRIIGNLYNDPIKFIQIYKMYKNKKENTIVYSNFYEEGILLFSKFLKKKKVPHKILDYSLDFSSQEQLLKDFKDKKINLLLIHPDFYQGINILGCRVIHILEPIIAYFQKEQLITRAIRYRSHSHLKTDERNVKIYNWSCSLYYDIRKALQFKFYFKELLGSTDKLRSYLDIMDFFSFQLSPDDKIMSKYNTIDNFYKELNNIMNKISIENNYKKIPLKCCIWVPDGNKECKNNEGKKLSKCRK